MNNRMD